MEPQQPQFYRPLSRTLDQVSAVLGQLWQRQVLRLFALTLLVAGGIRLTPYLAPIRRGDLVQNDQAIGFRDRNGLPLGTLLTRDQEHTVAVPLSQMSPHFIQAIIAAEDQRFYQHGALDERAIVRALLEAAQARAIVSGASTITMQLARMIKPTPRTAWGKLQEIWLAWRLTAGLNRDEILYAYLNRLPMGGNVYGVEAAARTFFGISAKDLTLAQATLLAGIPNAPNQLNPYDRWDRLKRRQQYVLRRMVEDGYITPSQADRAKAEVVTLQPPQQGVQAAPHFLFWLAGQLPDQHPPQITTTLDRPLQQFVEAQVHQITKSLAAHNAHQAAALVLDNHTGAVLAYVGSPDYFSGSALGKNDGVQALRQPGSTLKPFLYQLALARNVIQPNTILPDVPTRYAIPGARLYTPSDYSETYQGPVRVRYALANSLNVPAVRVLEKLTVPVFLHHLHQLGFTHLNHPPDYYGLGLTLGSGEVSLWELAQAYLTLARQGDRIPLKTSDLPSVSHSPSEAQQEPGVKARTTASWALIRDMLSDAHARARAFGIDSLLQLPFAAAVKTGTSSDFRDTWTVGFSQDYTVAVWVGNFDGSPMHKVSGVMGAAPLWHRIMLHLHQHQEPQAFAAPEGLLQRPICAISGAQPTPACPAVVQEYLFPENLATYDRQPDPFFQPAQASHGNRYQLTLPSEYNEWLALGHPSLESAKAGSAAALRIVAPHPGDFFLIEPANPTALPEVQQLQFRLASMPAQPVEWWLNGRLLATRSTPSLVWQPQPGHWVLEVRSGDQRDRVQFEVQQANGRPTRRGFSFSPQTK